MLSLLTSDTVYPDRVTITAFSATSGGRDVGESETPLVGGSVGNTVVVTAAWVAREL